MKLKEQSPDGCSVERVSDEGVRVDRENIGFVDLFNRYLDLFILGGHPNQRVAVTRPNTANRH